MFPQRSRFRRMEPKLQSIEEMTSMSTISIDLEEELAALLQGLNQSVQQAAHEFIVLVCRGVK